MFVFVLAVLVASCTSRGWYQELQRGAQRECLKNREECGEPVSYEEYKRERDQVLDED